MTAKIKGLWGAEWYSKNRLDGVCRHLMWSDGLPTIFKTRKAAREWIKSEYGYLPRRADLRREPHGWRMPMPVKIVVSVGKAPRLTNDSIKKRGRDK